MINNKDRDWGSDDRPWSAKHPTTSRILKGAAIVGGSLLALRFAGPQLLKATEGMLRRELSSAIGPGRRQGFLYNAFNKLGILERMPGISWDAAGRAIPRVTEYEELAEFSARYGGRATGSRLSSTHHAVINSHGIRHLFGDIMGQPIATDEMMRSLSSKQLGTLRSFVSDITNQTENLESGWHLNSKWRPLQELHRQFNPNGNFDTDMRNWKAKWNQEAEKAQSILSATSAHQFDNFMHMAVGRIQGRKNLLGRILGVQEADTRDFPQLAQKEQEQLEKQLRDHHSSVTPGSEWDPNPIRAGSGIDAGHMPESGGRIDPNIYKTKNGEIIDARVTGAVTGALWNEVKSGFQIPIIPYMKAYKPLRSGIIGDIGKSAKLTGRFNIGQVQPSASPDSNGLINPIIAVGDQLAELTPTYEPVHSTLTGMDIKQLEGNYERVPSGSAMAQRLADITGLTNKKDNWLASLPGPIGKVLGKVGDYLDLGMQATPSEFERQSSRISKFANPQYGGNLVRRIWSDPAEAEFSDAIAKKNALQSSFTQVGSLSKDSPIYKELHELAGRTVYDGGLDTVAQLENMHNHFSAVNYNEIRSNKLSYLLSQSFDDIRGARKLDNFREAIAEEMMLHNVVSKTNSQRDLMSLLSTGAIGNIGPTNSSLLTAYANDLPANLGAKSWMTGSLLSNITDQNAELVLRQLRDKSSGSIVRKQVEEYVYNRAFPALSTWMPPEERTYDGTAFVAIKKGPNLLPDTKKPIMDSVYEMMTNWNEHLHQLGSSRNGEREITTATVGASSPFAKASQINNYLSHIGLGLSPDSLGSGVDALKNIALKRVLPIAAGTFYAGYASWEIRRLLYGKSADEEGNAPGPLTNLRAHLGIGWTWLKQVTGITNLQKEAIDFVPGLDNYLQPKTVKEYKEYLKNGYDQVRQGAVGLAGLARINFFNDTPVYGGKTMFWKPSWYATEASDAKFSETGETRDEFYSRAWLPTPRHLLCLAPDQQVLTDNGLVPIQEVTQGTKVYGIDGKLHRVTGISNRNTDANEGLVKLILSGRKAFPLKATPKHPVFAIKKEDVLNCISHRSDAKHIDNILRNADSSDVTNLAKWLPIDELSKGDYVLSPRLVLSQEIDQIDLSSIVYNSACTETWLYEQLTPESAFLIEQIEKGNTPPIGYHGEVRKWLEEQSILAGTTLTPSHLELANRRINRKSITRIPRYLKLTEELGRVCGRFVAEGHTNNPDYKSGNLVSLTIHTDELPIVLSEVTDLENLLGFSLNIKTKTTGNCSKVTLGCSWLATSLRTLFGTSSYNKTLPPEVFNAPIPFINGLMKSYLDGDGWYNGSFYCSISKNLVLQFALLHEALNNTASSISQRTDDGIKKVLNKLCNTHMAWKVSLPPQKSKSGIVKNNFILREVIESKPITYDGTVYDIEVENSESFLTATCLVHNSTLKRLTDPYWFERVHAEDRPYPVTGDMFAGSEKYFGPLGNLARPFETIANATIGRILKPKRVIDQVYDNLADINEKIAERESGGGYSGAPSFLHRILGNTATANWKTKSTAQNWLGGVLGGGSPYQGNYSSIGAGSTSSVSGWNGFTYGETPDDYNRDDVPQGGLLRSTPLGKNTLYQTTTNNLYERMASINKTIHGKANVQRLGALEAYRRPKGSEWWDTGDVEAGPNIGEQASAVLTSLANVGGLTGQVNRLVRTLTGEALFKGDSHAVDDPVARLESADLGYGGHRNKGIDYVNELKNRMPGWLPGEEGYVNYRVGDSYSKIRNGETRLPGAGYEKLHNVKVMQTRASSLGKSVDDIIGGMLNIEQPMSKYAEEAADAGTRIHRKIQRRWQSEGLAESVEEEMYNKRDGISGHLDAILKLPEGRTVVDIKTVNAKRYRQAQRKPFEEHLDQVNWYMHEKGISRGAIMYLNRDDPEETTVKYFGYSGRRYNSTMNKVASARKMIRNGIEDGSISRGDTYSPLDRFKILADVAPFAEQTKIVASQLSNKLDPDSKEWEEFQATKDRLQKQKQSYNLYPYRFGRESSIVQHRATIDKVIDANTFTIKEDPLHPIKFAGIRVSQKMVGETEVSRGLSGSLHNMAREARRQFMGYDNKGPIRFFGRLDYALDYGKTDRSTDARDKEGRRLLFDPLVKVGKILKAGINPGKRDLEWDEALARVGIKPGARVDLKSDPGYKTDSLNTERALVFAGGKNVNAELLDRNWAKKQRDKYSPVQNLLFYSPMERVLGRVGEAIAHADTPLNCIAPWTSIITDYGITTADKLAIGDKVLTSSGRFKPVEVVQEQREGKRIVDIKLCGSSEILTVTEDHPILALHSERKKRITSHGTGKKLDPWGVNPKPEFILAGSIKSYDYVAFVPEVMPEFSAPVLDLWSLNPERFGKDTCSVWVPFGKLGATNAKRKRYVTVTNDISRLLGYYAAEGCTSYGRGKLAYTIFTFHKDELDYISDVCRISSQFGKPRVITKDNTTHIYIGSCYLSELVNHYVGVGHNKRAPKELLTNSGLRAEFLRGLFRGDGAKSGYSRYDHIEITAINLLTWVRDALASLWKIPAIITSEELRGFQTHKPYSLHIGKWPLLSEFFDGYCAYKLQDAVRDGFALCNRTVLNDGSNTILYRVKSVVTSEYQGKTIDIQVADDDTFATFNASVHNTKFLRSRSPIEEYERGELYGKTGGSWSHPFRDKIVPAAHRMWHQNPLSAMLTGAAIAGAFWQTPGKQYETNILEGRFGIANDKVRLAIMGAGAAVGLIGSTIVNAVHGPSNPWIPERRRKEHDLQEYFDTLDYVKSKSLAKKYKELAYEKEGINVDEILYKTRMRAIGNKRDRQALEFEKAELRKSGRGRTDAKIKEINLALKNIAENETVQGLAPYAARAVAYEHAAEKTMYGLPSWSTVGDRLIAIPRKHRQLVTETMQHGTAAEKRRLVRELPNAEARVIGRQLDPEYQPEQRQNLVEYFQHHYLPRNQWAGYDEDQRLAMAQAKEIQRMGMDPNDAGPMYHNQFVAGLRHPLTVGPFDTANEPNARNVKDALYDLLGDHVDGLDINVHTSNMRGRTKVHSDLGRDRSDDYTDYMNKHRQSF